MNSDAIQGFPLSPPQEHLWRTDRATSNVGLRLAVEGALDAGLLTERLEALAGDEEILRSFVMRLGETNVGVQAVGDAPRIEVVEVAPSESEQAFRRALEEPLAHAQQAACVRAVFSSIAPLRHELLLVQSAGCADHHSLGLLAAALLAPDPEADPERMQYADLAQWLREMFEDEDSAEGLGFWRRVPLQDVSALRAALERPTDDVVRPSADNLRPIACDLSALHRAAERLGTNASVLLFGLWRHLLAKHTDREDPILGLAAPGRSYEGLDGAMGRFQRVLPIHVPALQDDAHATFSTLASHLDEAQEWHELWDLAHLREGDAPRFLPFVYEHLAAGSAFSDGGVSNGWSGRGLRLVPREHLGHGDPFRLKLRLDDAAGALHLHYDPEAFTADAVEAMGDQLETLIAGVLANPESPPSTWPLVSDAMQARLLEAFAVNRRVASPNDSGAPLLLHQRVLQHAQAQPEAVAVAAADGHLSYAELAERATHLARRLAAAGVGPGDFVGISMERSSKWIVAIQAVLQSGAAYVPLPPSYPDERLTFLLEDTRAKVLLTSGLDRERFAPAGIQILEIEGDAEVENGAPIGDALRGPAAHDPAYVIYTSGSTGTPKGVPVSHANLAFSTDARHGYYEAPLRSYLLVSSFAFDSSIVGIFWTLSAGGKLVLPAEGEETDLNALADWIEREAVTHTLALPSLWSVLLQEIPAERLGSLSTVIVAGEACRPDLPAQHAASLNDCGLFNEYGPTEATVWSTVHDCLEPNQRSAVPIGRPIPGARVHVLDAEGRPVAIGLAGELHVGGPGVTGGYWQRPELTAERFVPNPFSGAGADGSSRLYRTGDLARFLPDGRLEFLGRIDHQVKVRGYRVELGEIEARLQAHPSVREAVVQAFDDGGTTQLAAYVANAGEAAEPQALRAHLALALPDYMVPPYVLTLDDLPRLPNGKVDRKALPTPSAESRGRGPYVAPESPLETVLAELWAEVLELDRVGAEDDFFALGGHSILATQLFARITDTLDVRIALRTLFETRTVRGLTQAMLAGEDADGRVRLERTAELLMEVLQEHDGHAQA